MPNHPLRHIPSVHELLESEKIVDRYAFIHEGRIIAEGSARELKSQYLTNNFT